ncbi:diguanylate cyclase [Bacillus siamensis]|uniref:GGDEF domain-containing protein n=1 Tax=Bacillus siamensis TaxID=659243 RepID=UPI002E219BB1|nr:diguanylate cyclase [Bacillus siamensis]MED5047348.1 diguanylate cyclase [Bacillus siamensis]MED5097402.1 diguanylate cyclase [Bacillus siamensis]
MLKELFLNLTILITFNYLFTLLFKESLSYKEDRPMFQLLKGAACGLLGVFLIAFGFSYSDSIIDLRNIPIIIAALYGGWVSTAVAFAIIVAGRILINFNASAIFSIAAVGIIAILSVAVLRGKKPDRRRAFVMLLFSNVIFTLTLLFLVPEQPAGTLVYYWLISTLGGMLSLYIIKHEADARLLFKKYKFQANYDFLTGIFNKRKFEEISRLLYDRASRSASSQLALIYLDIDHFKQINDQYGHYEGDQVLKELGTRLRLLISSSDPSARIGGEEFAVLIPNCTYTKGLHLAEEIRQTMDGNPILLTSGDTIFVTVSIGIAHYPTNTADPQTLPLIADRMLYKAKTSGRNQVCSTEKKE